MSKIRKFLKYAKDMEVQPPSKELDEKIIHGLSNIKNKDKVLDENFLRFLRNSNSRYYLLKEGIKNNPGKFLLIVSVLMIAGAFIFAVAKNILLYEKEK